MDDGLSGNYITDGTADMNALITKGTLVTDDNTQHMENGKLDAILSESEITDMAKSLSSIYAARTTPTKNKFQGRKGAKAVKRLERLESQ